MTPLYPWESAEEADFSDDPEPEQAEWDRPGWEDVEAQVGLDYWLWAANWRYGK